MNENFRKAKYVYFDKLKLPGKPLQPLKEDPNSKYAQAARLGLCFHCFREDTDPTHRPAAANMAFCKECMIEMTVGVDKLELQNKYEVHRWFSDRNEAP
jgi:hypothetical protein